ncbi:MAG: hypothetical protein JW739_05315 [Opitutales bacterium]|nr:hypothetical protein [Opitutales bacterium]
MKSVGFMSTAGLPWFTGTSIIPLQQAVYLKKRGYDTALYLPWLKPERQKHCYQKHLFRSPEEQAAYIRNWLPEDLRAYCPELLFYPATYSKKLGSTVPMRNPARVLKEHDSLVLIDPEHLFALYPWSRIRRKQAWVIGEVMTNYEYFFSPHVPRFVAKQLQAYCRFILQRMCHRLAPISAVQKDICALSKSSVVPLNAADRQFFRPPPSSRNRQYYFIGKLIPEKGLAELFNNLQACGVDSIDLYGAGAQSEVETLAAKAGISPNLKGVLEKPWEVLPDYRIFVNCSRSEYLCSTTANALAMQQWVILPKHPSNEYYYSFKNCLPYRTQAEFVEQFRYARKHEPVVDPKLSGLTWEETIERLIELIQAPC